MTEVPEELPLLLADRALGGAALDLGCGGGVATAFLARSMQPTVGLDIAYGAVSQARKLAIETGAPAAFVVADATALPFRADAFSLIFDRGCLQNLPESTWPDYFPGIQRLIQPGGVLQLYCSKASNQLPSLFSRRGVRARLARLRGTRGPGPQFLSQALIRALVPPSLSVVTLADRSFRSTKGNLRDMVYGVFEKKGGGHEGDGVSRSVPKRRFSRSLLGMALVFTACTGVDSDRAGPPRPSVPVTTGPEIEQGGEESREAQLPADLLMSSSFEERVCGRWSNPKPGCEFGVEGNVEAGSYDPRTGDQAIRIDRTSPNHMGVIADVPLPDGHAFVGVAHRIPALPDGAIPAQPGHLQLEQLSPTDGNLPGWPVEVRLYPDRRLGLALFKSKEVTMADWQVPVDEWFYVVVELNNGTGATQQMWIFDEQDRLMSKVEATLDTRQSWPHEHRTALKVGGSTASLQPLFTYADDWYVSRNFEGPLHFGHDGMVVSD